MELEIKASVLPACLKLGQVFLHPFFPKEAKWPPPNSQGCLGKMGYLRGSHDHQVSASELLTLCQVTVYE